MHGAEIGTDGASDGSGAMGVRDRMMGRGVSVHQMMMHRTEIGTDGASDGNGGWGIRW